MRKLPTVEVERHSYWTLRIRDEFRPKGEEWYKRFETREAAETEANRLVQIEIATKIERPVDKRPEDFDRENERAWRNPEY